MAFERHASGAPLLRRSLHVVEAVLCDFGTNDGFDVSVDHPAIGGEDNVGTDPSRLGNGGALLARAVPRRNA